MTTQLDRLEALTYQSADRIEEPWSDEDAAYLVLVHKTLPDLIRVARAASKWTDSDGVHSLCSCGHCGELRALANGPLFCEVES